ncbi:cupin domain-containing protein [Vitreimonas sp.]|uniref:cupin domain-containing protein n=1 Tax=Vitreimonas sp. TaxID=3069702 RepID=UPI002ED89A31
MNVLKTAAAACVAALALSAAPAFAGECPTGQVATNALADAPTMPNRVTDDVIASIDLSDRYGVPGRHLRMRRLVVQPGGVVPLHSHGDRPANIYVVEGQITEYRTTCAVGVTHREGDVVAEQGEVSHWWRNNSRRPAILISADIPPAEGSAQGGM